MRSGLGAVLVLVAPAFGQASLVGHWDGHNGSYADVWGDGDFAYLAHFNHAGVNIVDISDPENPVGIEYLLPPPNTGASAQDVKVADGLLFVGLEGNDDASVHIVDVRDPMNPVPLIDVVIPGYTHIHNVFYDQGYLYLADSGTPRVGIVDLTELDPDNPPPVPISQARWIVQNVGSSMVHDITVVDGRLYACAWDSGLWIYDVSDVAASPPSFLGSIGGQATHSCWPTANGDYVVTGEERTGGGIQVYRIIDQGTSVQLQLTDALAFPPEVTFSVHNQLIDGYRLYNSWYGAGMWTHDIDPGTGELEFVANYQTPGSVWGVYPFLGPARILLSDTSQGLFIVRVENLTFEYPDGLPEQLDPSGDSIRVRISVDGGLLEPGSAKLHFTGGADFVVVDLVPLSDEHMFEAIFPSFACGTEVSFYLSARTSSSTAYVDPPGAPEAMHRAVASTDLLNAFVDDFEIDEGWTVENSPELTAGAWERGVPAGGGDRGDPALDADGSGQCYLTMNVDGNSDVDDGTTTLVSPILDAAGVEGVPFIAYARWYSNDSGLFGNEDSMPIEISNDGGQTWTLLEEVTENANAWVHREVRIDEVVAPTGQMRIRFSARDFGEGSIVEAGVDDVRIVFYQCLDEGNPDVNGDGVVDVQDLVEVVTNWGPCPPDPAPCPADIDGDGMVGITDLTAVIVNWSS